VTDNIFHVLGLGMIRLKKAIKIQSWAIGVPVPESQHSTGETDLANLGRRTSGGGGGKVT
jgi:hypothetical protein